jgi:hypothetical protein
MDCSGRCRGCCRLRPRSASRNDISDDDSARAGTCRGTRACATFTSQDCADDNTHTDHDPAARRLTGVERLLQDRVTRWLSARLRKTRGVFSIEKCRLRDSSAGDCIQSVHEPERSARPRGKECSRATARSGGGDRQSGDTWHSGEQLRERHLSKVPHIVSTVLSAATTGRSRLWRGGGPQRDRPRRRAGVGAVPAAPRGRGPDQEGGNLYGPGQPIP